MVRLLYSPNGDLPEQCFWCLGNIAGDGISKRDLILAEKVFVQLLAIVEAMQFDLSFGKQLITATRDS